MMTSYSVMKASIMFLDNWMYEATPWPAEDGTFPFKEFMMAYYDKMHDLSMNIIKLICIGKISCIIKLCMIVYKFN